MHHRLLVEAESETLDMRCQHDKEKDTDLMRRGRNLFYRTISHLTPLLRRTTSPPHPIDTLRCPLKASFAGDTAATLHLPMLTALARLRDTTTGDEARRRHNPSYRNVRVSLGLVMMVRRRGRHAGKHRDRSGGRHGGGGRVDLGMERGIDWRTHARDRPRDRIGNGLRNRDRRDGVHRAVDLRNPNIRHHKHAYKVPPRGGSKKGRSYLSNVQLIRRLRG